MAFKMRGFTGFKEDDPPGTENEIMSTMRDMVSDGATNNEIYGYAASAGDGESNYSFNTRTGDMEANGPNGRRVLTKDTETLGLWDSFKPRFEGDQIIK